MLDKFDKHIKRGRHNGPMDSNKSYIIMQLCNDKIGVVLTFFKEDILQNNELFLLQEISFLQSLRTDTYKNSNLIVQSLRCKLHL